MEESHRENAIMNKFGISNGKTESSNLSFDIYGARFHGDQTLYEYLIEFLLIFSSAKSSNHKDGKMQFHKSTDNLEYYAENKMGLKRFIFYNESKKDTSVKADKEAYDYMIQAIKAKMDVSDPDKTISYLQDLLRGYAVVLKKRSWCVQSTLPICPELIFSEAMPNLKNRKDSSVVKAGDDISVDSSFDFTKRNFLARGGELYYLHLLQALLGEKKDKVNQLEELLENLLTQQSKKISAIARFVQDTWEERMNLNDLEREKLFQKYSLAWMPADAYGDAGEYAVDELINYLSASIQQIKKIEILSEGMMFQILRMLHTGACNKSGTVIHPWIVDMSSGESSDIKKLSSNSFRVVQDDFKLAINEASREHDWDSHDQVKQVREAQKESVDIFRSKGKEIRCIIPISGSFERFTLSENVLRFLVLSIIKPGEKMTLDTFMDQLYDHFHIVVGPKQYKKTLTANADNSKITMGNVLEENVSYFQSFLNSIGCLKELSDATSIVVNAYSSVEESE